MDDQNKNLILATVLSVLVILVWFLLFPPEQPVVDATAPIQGAGDVPVAQVDAAGEAATSETALAEQSRADPISHRTAH